MASSMQVRELDVSSFASIRKFSNRWAKLGRRIDCLINNAGIFSMNGGSLQERLSSALISTSFLLGLPCTGKSFVGGSLKAESETILSAGQRTLTGEGIEAHLGTNHLGAFLLTLLLLPALQQAVGKLPLCISGFQIYILKDTTVSRFASMQDLSSAATFK